MPSSRLVIGGAAAAATAAAAAARSLRRLRKRRKPVALLEDGGVQADVETANQTFANALVETAAADPDISNEDVAQLRDELRRELERLAGADVKASRTGLSAQPPG